MQIWARKTKRCAYPPINKYTKWVPFKKKFEDLEIKDPDDFVLPTKLRPDGQRDPQAEANILGRIRTILQGRAGFSDAGVENRQS